MSSAAPSPKPTPTPEQVKAWLPLYARKTDAFIAHLQRVLSTTSGLDSVLCFTYYASTLLASQLHVVSNLLRLSPSTTAVEKQAALAVRKQQIKSLASLCSDVRAFIRLSGLLSMYRWGVSTYQNPPKDAVLRNIAYSQVAVNTVYQAIENSAYLAKHGIISMEGAKQKQFWLYTSRLWMVHTALDFLRLARTAQLGSSSEKDVKTKREAADTWWRELYVNSAYAPLSVHWSTETGLIEDTWVGVCGSIAGLFSLRQAWRRTQV